MAGVAEWARTPGDESGAVDDKQSHLPGDDCQQHEAGGCRVSWGQVSIIVNDKWMIILTSLLTVDNPVL